MIARPDETGAALPTPFQPFAPRWNEPQLTREELSLPNAFEWWYFDLESAADVRLVVIFSRKSPIYSPDKPSIHLEFEDGSTSLQRVHNYPVDSFRWSSGRALSELRLGDNAMRIRGDGPAEMVYEIDLNLPELTARLEFMPLHLGFLPGPGGCYFTNREEPHLRSCVSFSAPLMAIRGTITHGDRTHEVTGHGYHDHPWGTEVILRTHRQWYWGRLAAPDRRVVFAKVAPTPEFDGELEFHFVGEAGNFTPSVSSRLDLTTGEWARDAWHGVRFPRKLHSGLAGGGWSTEFKASMLDSPVINRSLVSWASLDGLSEGRGWVEYYSVNPRFRSLVMLGSRATAFFWRPFPYSGR